MQPLNWRAGDSGAGGVVQNQIFSEVLKRILIFIRYRDNHDMRRRL
jgi:hypothetical protein